MGENDNEPTWTAGYAKGYEDGIHDALALPDTERAPICLPESTGDDVYPVPEICGAV